MIRVRLCFLESPASVYLGPVSILTGLLVVINSFIVLVNLAFVVLVELAENFCDPFYITL